MLTERARGCKRRVFGSGVGTAWAWFADGEARCNAKGVFDLVVAQLAVGTVGVDEELPVALEEPGGHTSVGEFRIVEVAEHGLLGCLLHCAVVVRTAKGFHFLRVTPGARRNTDILCRRAVGRRLRCGFPPGGREVIPRAPAASQGRWTLRRCETAPVTGADGEWAVRFFILFTMLPDRSRNRPPAQHTTVPSARFWVVPDRVRRLAS